MHRYARYIPFKSRANNPSPNSPLRAPMSGLARAARWRPRGARTLHFTEAMVVEAAPAGCTPSHGSVDVYFLGPLGTYSHQAARELVAGQAASLCAKPTIEDTVQAGLSAVSCQGNAEAVRPSLVVAPVENSFQGPVLEAFQCLAKDEVFGSKGLEIVDEIHLTIAHALIVRSPEVDMAQVQVVRSHPQVCILLGLPRRSGSALNSLQRSYPRRRRKKLRLRPKPSMSWASTMPRLRPLYLLS